ncbi:MAG: ThiF family adenylyltransferase [Chloroflexi bacterium]|nr:MAG: ThiF family adenylyltransferase [Chloroflexota bacterium]
MASDGEPLIVIGDPEQDRYARLRLMDGYRQDVIERVRIMGGGAGALGNEVLKNLALLGAGHLFVVDFDTIEISNLTRSILYRADDRGRSKAEVAAERVRQINPDVKAIPWKGNIAHEVGLGVFRQMDIVFGCLDNREARLAVNRACWRVGVPWIDGALNVADGSVRVFIPRSGGACYECLMTKQDYALLQIRYACPPATLMEGVAITTPMSASIIGAMQVQEAVKLLHGIPVDGGQGVYYSAETLRTTHVAYPRRADCPAHQAYERVIRVEQSVAALTVGDVMRIAGEHLEGKAVLALPAPVVTALYCPRCDQPETVYRPYRDIVPGAVPCPVCGTERIYDAASSIASGQTTHDIPLVQLGFPPLDILDVRAGRTHLYLELGGDQAQVLVGW